MKAKHIFLLAGVPLFLFSGLVPAHSRPVDCEQIAKKTAAYFSEPAMSAATHESYVINHRFGIEMAEMSMDESEALAEISRVAKEVNDGMDPEYKDDPDVMNGTTDSLYARLAAYREAVAK